MDIRIWLSRLITLILPTPIRLPDFNGHSSPKISEGENSLRNSKYEELCVHIFRPGTNAG